MTARLRDAGAKRLESMAPVNESAPSSERLCAPIPIRQIMVPLPGIRGFGQALPYASAIAEATGAGISLVWFDSSQDRPGANASERSPLDELAEARRQLGFQVFGVRTQVIRGAEALRGCVDAECADGADLVTLGMGAPLGDSQHGAGRVAEAMIARGQAPVLLIPPAAPPPPRSVRVLALLDGSGQAELALFPIIALANAMMGRWIGEITLLMVCPTQEKLTDASAYLGAVRKSLERLVVPRIPIHIESVLGRPTSMIVELANETATPRFDLLALTTHGQGHTGETLLGPVAKHVLAHARLPMLVMNSERS
jgi:nucleotide-binding universal stress UspA family protein